MFSIDVGFGNTKVFDGKQIACIPSVYCEALPGEYASEDANDIVLELDGVSYHVGEYARQRDGIAAFDRTDMLRQKLMILAAICSLTEDDYKGPIAVGLPICDMEVMKTPLEELKGKYKVVYNGDMQVVDITSVLVFAQGEAIYDSLVSNNEGIKETIGIIDIGQKTVDYCYYSHGVYNPAFSGSFNEGCSKGYTEIRQALMNLPEPINCSMYNVGDYIHKVPEAADRAWSKLAKNIRAMLANAGWQWGMLDKVYVAGGGAGFLGKSLLSIIKNAEVVEDPINANVKGFYRKAAKK